MNEWENVGAEGTEEMAGADVWGAADEDVTDFFAAGLEDGDIAGVDTTSPEMNAADDITPEETMGDDDEAKTEAGTEEGADTTAAGGAKGADTTGLAKGEAINKNNVGKSSDENNDEKVYTLKICGEERKMSLPEVLALAQKGGDYDRVRANYDGIKEEAYRLKELAAASGKSTTELLESLAKAERDGRVNQMVNELNAEGVDGKLAEVLAELLVDKAEGESARAMPTDEGDVNAIAPGGDAAVSASIKKLVEVYGVQELPEEVIRLSADKGMLPFEAYQAWMIAEGAKREEELNRKLAAKAKARDNRAKGVGSLQGAGASRQDPFLAGFGLE